MFRRVIATFFLLAPIAAGCFVEPTDAPEPEVAGDATENRGPIGKADLSGLCLEVDIKLCGGKSSGNCYCDEACESFGDCCADYQQECVDDSSECNAKLICGQAISCIDGQWYPTTCGPANCDAPMGECGAPQACGGLIGVACDAGEFCNFAPEDGCGFADAMGTCEATPQECAEIYAPVCGCDGNNYGNACEANAAGASVQQTGDCECDPGFSMQYCWGQLQCSPVNAQC